MIVVRVAPPATPTTDRATDDIQTIMPKKLGKTGAIRSNEKATSLRTSAKRRHCLQLASSEALFNHVNNILDIIPKPSFSNHVIVAAKADAF